MPARPNPHTSSAPATHRRRITLMAIVAGVVASLVVVGTLLYVRGEARRGDLADPNVGRADPGKGQVSDHAHSDYGEADSGRPRPAEH